MTPTPRCALLLAIAACSALLVGPDLALAAMLAIGAACLLDTLFVLRAPRLQRSVPSVVARGVPAAMRVDAQASHRVDVRQPLVPDVREIGRAHV